MSKYDIRPSLFTDSGKLTRCVLYRYFNTVGSKEGWTPSTFVSSRTNRRKDDDKATKQRAEDYMDDEDLADAQAAQQLKVTGAFAGLGASDTDGQAAGALSGLLKVEGDTMGLKLLRRMGWKDGQGIGPRIRRSARLGMSKGDSISDDEHLFAPDDTPLVKLATKLDKKGLGFQGQAKLKSLQRNKNDEEDDEEDEPINSTNMFSQNGKKSAKVPKRGFGVGVLNDTGSDDEDPYEMGPKISYNRVMGGDSKKKNKSTKAASNPKFKNKPVFIPKTARTGGSLRKCHDGRLPLSGFILAQEVEDLMSTLSLYAPPSVPQGWKSAKSLADAPSERDGYKSAADAAKASTLDPRSRAAILGEKALPGKSVFDYISSTTRDQLAAASGKSNLPPARGEVPAESLLSDAEKLQQLCDQVPALDRDTAIAALARGSTGPYSDNERKKAQYRSYLEYAVNPSRPMPPKQPGVSDSDYIKELSEFYNCARIFKPMTGFMASRFTTAKSSTTPSNSGNGDSKTELVSKPEPKMTDPAEEAAKVGMYGALTRTVQDFYPSRLLCKRFNVRPPAHSQPDHDPRSRTQDAEGFQDGNDTSAPEQITLALEAPPDATAPKNAVEAMDPDTNAAVEGEAADPGLLHAIFGDSDDE